MLPGKSLTPEEVVRILLQRRWLILLPFALGLAAAPFVSKRIPAVYRSETLIMVVPQRVPENYVKATVTATVADRLPAISEQILSRSRLEKVITDFDLYPELRKRWPMEDVVRRMQADIGSPEIQDGAQSFRVSYENRDPRVAQQVTARLARLFIDQNSEDRENLANSTNVFLESQLEEAKVRLLDHERKVEEYRRMHTGELPSQLESNLRASQAAQLQLQSVNDQMNHASERRLLLERQLGDAQTMPSSIQMPFATAAPDPASLTLAQQLEVAQRTLDNMKQRFTSEYPEVRKLERAVKELRDRVAEEAKHSTPRPDILMSPAEQARLKRIRDLESEIAVLDHQLATNQKEVARLKALIEDYQHKVDAVPKRESELVELTRDYETLKKTYESLLTKREDSKLAANLERRQIGEQFRILDSASLPIRPSNQAKRLGISLSSAGVGLLLGLLVTALLVYKDSSLGSEEDVAKLLNVPVLATVPSMTSEPERRSRQIRGLMMDVAGSVVVIGSALFVVWGLLRP